MALPHLAERRHLARAMIWGSANVPSLDLYQSFTRQLIVAASAQHTGIHPVAMLLYAKHENSLLHVSPPVSRPCRTHTVLGHFECISCHTGAPEAGGCLKRP